MLLCTTAKFLQCFFFAVLKIHVASKKLEQTTYTNKLLKKKTLQVWKFCPRATYCNYNQADLRLKAQMQLK